MAWRYRRSVKLFPGVRLNIGKHGISTTIGIPGASINLSRRGTYVNAGLPGTGISSRTRIGAPHRPTVDPPQPPATPAPTPPPTAIPTNEPGAIASGDVESITSPGLDHLRQLMIDAHSQRVELDAHIASNEHLLPTLELRLQQTERSWLNRAFFSQKIKVRQEAVRETKAEIEELRKQRDLSVVDIDVKSEPELEAAYQKLSDAFDTLAASRMIWDITSSVEVGVSERSEASAAVNRQPVAFDRMSLELITSSHRAMRLQNANGGDLYIYPGFVLMLTHQKQLGLIDLSDVSIEFRQQQFLEEEDVPSDTTVIDHTWKRINKDGSPDRRFSDNRQLPVVRYGELHLTSPSGLNEEYWFSNAESAGNFADAFSKYRTLIAGHESGRESEPDGAPRDE